MAFKMNRPIIKGTPLHKASIAKATSESIVAQTRTQADGSLVAAAGVLGESYIPAAIDYSIDQKAIKIPKGKEKPNPKPKKEKEIDMDELLKEDEDEIVDAGLDDERAVNPNKKDRGYKNWKVREEEENIRLAEENKARLDAASAKRKEAQRLKDIQMNKKKGQVYEPGSIKADAVGGKQISQYTKEQRDRLASEGAWSDEAEKMVLPEEIVDGKFVSKAEGTNLEVVATDPKGDNQTNNTVVEEADQNTTTTRTREQKENDKIYNDFRTSKYKKRKMIEGGYNPIQSKSPVEMRDDRIYRNALKDGPVRKNMIKGGYTPR